MQKGIVLSNISNLYKVESEGKVYDCNARGKFKNNEISPVAGDIVQIDITDENKLEGVIDKIEERTNYIKRPKMANITQLILVISSRNPKPDLLMLDKQLTFAEFLNLKVCIVLNKIDLDEEKEFKRIKEIYTKIGYEVIETRG